MPPTAPVEAPPPADRPLGLFRRMWDAVFGPPEWFRRAEEEQRRFRGEMRERIANGCRRI